jgi:S-adenosyl-L-methionine hydrolase (adenosine-forming)
MMRPIVFLTDYGLDDEFVGVCHGVIELIAPGVRVIDLTHQIARQNVLQGAVTLARSARFVPVEAVFLAVVDPGVGSGRRSVAVEAASGALLVGPDNGLLSMAWRELGGAIRAVEIASGDVLLQPVSKTFHGRDVFAPAAAHLAAGFPFEKVGPQIEVGSLLTVDLPGPMLAPGQVGARVVGVDGFGNVQLNVRSGDLDSVGLGQMLGLGTKRVPRVGTFADVARGSLAAIVDSQGFVALVVNQGSAAESLHLRVGDPVVLGE